MSNNKKIQFSFCISFLIILISIFFIEKNPYACNADVPGIFEFQGAHVDIANAQIKSWSLGDKYGSTAAVTSITIEEQGTPVGWGCPKAYCFIARQQYQNFHPGVVLCQDIWITFSWTCDCCCIPEIPPDECQRYCPHDVDYGPSKYRFPLSHPIFDYLEKYNSGDCIKPLQPEPLQEQDKYKNLGPQNNESDVGEPFNLTTGNVYTYPSHDIIVKGRLPIDFYRIYNSQSDYSSALGYGWNHSYDMFLLNIDSNSIRVNIEEGKSIYFFKNTNDIYTPMAGYAAHSLVKKQDSSFTYRLPQGKKYQFNSNGKLILIEDRNANTLTCAYDEMGRLTSITDGSGRNITFTYHSNDKKIRTIADPAGRIVAYSYDGNDNLVTVTNPDGTQIRYEYNDPYDLHNLTKVIDENGHTVVSYQYDAQDRVTFSERENGVDALTITYNSSNQTTLTNSKGEEIIYIFASIDGTKVITNIAGAGCRTCDTKLSSIFYDENLNRTLEIDRNGNSTGYTYDDNGNMLRQSNPKRYFTYDPNFNLVKTAQEFPPGIVKYFTYDSRGNLLSASGLFNSYPTKYEYNNFGDLIKETDPRGNITTFTYNQYGYLISETDAIGNTTHYTYDIIGNLLSATNPRGDNTSYTYDLMNRVKKVTLPDGNSIDYTYDSVGNRISVTDQNGNIVTTTYDEADRIISITNSSQESIVYSYDTESNRTRTEILDSIGQIITYTDFDYDNQNRLIAETDANNNKKNYTYDLAGKLISSVDGNGSETRYEYDQKNRIVKVINPLGGTIRNTYDFVKDYLKSVCDPNGNITTYDYKFYYDRLIVKTVSPETGTTTYSYDKNGNLFEKTEADGTKTVYDYDPLNRLTKISSQGTEYVKYSYDSIGNITLMEDTSGITKFEYDRIGNPIKEAKTIKDETYCYETRYTYDAANRLISITYPSGRKIVYTYNSNNRIVSITSQTDDKADSIIDSVEYLPFGPIASYNYGNGLTTQIDYYRNISIQNININPLYIHRTYAYDSAKNITRIDINYPSLTTNNYAYDSINQITSAHGSWGTISLSYDRSGNRTTKTSGAGVTNYSYTSNKISSISGIESDYFTHDSKGNITSNEQFQYIYDLNNRLIRIEDLSDILANYTYDGEGKRIKKQVGDVNTLYFYDQDGHLISEINSNQCIDYIYLDDALIARGEAPLKISHEMNIPAGWNMISLPVLPDNASVTSLFPDAKVVYGYKKGAGYVRVKNEEEMELGKGYWILLDQNQTYTLTGRLIQSYTLPVYEDGWHMIGGCTSGAWLKTDRCNIVVIYKYVQGGGYQRILTSEEIQPGEGYWILCSDVEGQCELRADTTGSSEKLEAEKEVDTNSDHILFYHLDHLNTPILITNQDSTIVWEAEYLPFGQVIINEDPDGNGEMVVNNIRFPGQYYDAESGLHYNMMRYYDPELGRYLTPDPIGFAGGDLNLYRYVWNNPVRWVDPLGLCNMDENEKDLMDKIKDILDIREKIDDFIDMLKDPSKYPKNVVKDLSKILVDLAQEENKDPEILTPEEAKKGPLSYLARIAEALRIPLPKKSQDSDDIVDILEKYDKQMTEATGIPHYKR